MPCMTATLQESPQLEILFSEEQIAARIAAMAVEIAVTRPTNLLVVPILKGSFIFAADLLRAMHRAGLSLEVDFMMLAATARPPSRPDRWRFCATSTPTSPAAMCCCSTTFWSRAARWPTRKTCWLPAAPGASWSRRCSTRPNRRAVQIEGRLRRLPVSGQLRGRLWHGHGARVPRVPYVGRVVHPAAAE